MNEFVSRGKLFLLALLVLFVIQHPFAQNYADGTGKGSLQREVFWLTWNSNLVSKPAGADTLRITAGEYIWMVTDNARVRATVSNITPITAGSSLRIYNSGEFATDGLQLLYPGLRGMGLKDSAYAGQIKFDISVELEVKKTFNSAWTSVTYPGMVIADGESLADGEFLKASAASNSVDWQVLDMRVESFSKNPAQYTLTISDNGKTAGVSLPAGQNDIFVQSVLFGKNISQLSNVETKGRGYTAIGIGIVAPFDFGDAPTSYGDAGHYMGNNITFNSLTALADGNYSAMSLPKVTVTSATKLYFGNNNTDPDGNAPHSSTANLDDSTKNDDEDGVVSFPNIDVNKASNVVINLTATNSSTLPANVYGWIDFNGDGKFSIAESVTASVPAGSVKKPITLTFLYSKFSSIIKAGPTYARFRITTNTLIDNTFTPSIDERSTSIALDGETEDYKLKDITQSSPSKPEGVEDTDSTLINTPVITIVKNNDTLNAITATVGVATQPAHGSATVNADGSVTYNPATGYTGVDTYTYTLTSPGGLVSDPITVIVVVKPVGINDKDTTGINMPVTIPVKANDGASGSNGNTVSTSSNPSHGTVVVNTDGTITYTPNNGYSGKDTFTYVLTTPDGVVSNPIEVVVSIFPVGVNDAANTNINTPVTIPVKANDGSGATVDTVKLATPPAHGTALVNADGTVSYTPANGYTGKDTLTYTLTTPDGTMSLPITVIVTVKPVGVNDKDTTLVNTPVTIPVKNNDGPSGNNATVTIFSNPLHGTTSVNANGMVTYTPSTDFAGKDSFTYVLITPDGVVSAPITTVVWVLPMGIDDVANTPMNTPVGIPVKNNDGAGNVNDTVKIVATPNHGGVVVNADGTVNYTPTNGYTGKDTFTYSLTTPDGVVSAPITVIINVKPMGVNDRDTTVINASIAISVKNNDGAGATNNTVTIAANPIHGTASVNTNGTVQYTPSTGFTGRDTLNYVLTTPDGVVSDTIKVFVVVKPAGVKDNDTTRVNTPVVIPVKDNDGSSATNATVGISSSPTNGTVVVNTDGTVTYTPSTNYVGKDSFTYTITTPDGLVSAPITVVVTVKPPLPTGVKDVDSTVINVPVTIPVKNNDGVNAAQDTVKLATPPVHGTVVVNPNGTVTYTPTNGYTGKDSLTYTLTAPDGSVSAPITVSIAVKPQGVNDTTITPINTPVIIPVKNNDGASGNNTAVSTVTPPLNGTIVVNANGTTTYTPNAGFVGKDSFTYILTTPDGVNSLPIKVYITVTPPPPTGVKDVDSTLINVPVTIPVKNNDGINAPQDTVKLATPPVHGTVVVNPNGTVTYTPTNGYTGKDSLTYTLTAPDGSVSAPITVSIAVKPQGVNDTTTTPINTPVIISVKNNDGASGNTTTVSTVTPPLNGTVVVNANGTTTYTPNAGFVGKDSFTYILTTPDGVNSLPIKVYITVTPPPPTGVKDVDSTVINVPVTIPVKNNDGINATKDTVKLATPPVHGTVVVNPNGTVTYTPTNGYTGKDSLTYTLTAPDGSVSTPITVSIAVKPQGVNDTTTTPINTPVIIPVKNNDGASGNNATVSTVTPPLNGTVVVNANGTTTYTPNAGFVGKDSFTYILTTPDGVNSLPIKVYITVTPPPPTGVKDVDSTVINVPVTIPVKNNDGVNAPQDTVKLATPPVHGTVVVNPNGTVTYTPTNGYTGKDSLTYTLTSPNGSVSAPITVSIAVKPQGVNDTTTTPINTPVIISVKNNDGASGNNTSVSTVTLPLNGTVVVNANGTTTYTPNAGFVGKDSFTYILTTPDGVNSLPINVYITVTPLTVKGANDSDTTVINTPITIPVKNNDGPSATQDTVKVSIPPVHGTVVVNANGTVTYTPSPGYVGTDSIKYTLTSPGTTTPSAPISVAIVVKPVGQPDRDTTEANIPVTVGVIKNDGVSGTNSNVQIANPPLNGTVQTNGNGTVTYTPNSGFVGNDSFYYVLVTPDGVVSAPIKVNIVVTPAIPRKADIAVIKELNTPKPLSLGQTVSFTITVINNGVDNATGVVATDVLANNLSNYNRLNITAGSAFYSPSTRKITWNIGSLAANQIVSLTFEVTIASGTTLDNTAFVTAVQPDPDTTNNFYSIPQAIVLPSNLVVPNVITPNGDGKNDQFVIIGLNKYPNSELSIFNRWDNLVYTSNNYNNDWNGNGLSTGTYFYVLKLKIPTGGTEIMKGWVLLNR